MLSEKGSHTALGSKRYGSKGILPSMHSICGLLFKIDFPPVQDLRLGGMLIPTSCCLCSASDESRDHLFVDCPYTQIIWSLMLKKLSEVSITFTSSLQLLSWSSSTSTRSPRTLRSIDVQVIIYYTWTEKNNIVYKNRCYQPMTSSSLLTEWSGTQSLLVRPENNSRISWPSG
ncbi:uncharacterized protein LOC125578074 [Brassica napus]|uniref:uncharacterized protein LOC125578074 n=1 Tax=Brassica napus TaxID=3708 RepID=UPI00207871D1|nr:uncharacterized protein LOC125578074 [Brassica napus]